MPWAPATSPQPPRGESRVVVVDEAYLSPLRVGPLHSVSGPRRWMVGAVHEADGRVVTESQRLWHLDRNAAVSADPDVADVPVDGKRLSGTWLYAGHWTMHFGHFFLETLTNLWPDPAGPPVLGAVSGLVTHRSFRAGTAPATAATAAPDTSAWQRDLLALAGYGSVKLRVVRSRPAHVERLLVPSRPVVLKSWALPPAVDLWRRVARAATAPDAGPRLEHGPKVFLSRRLFHATRQGEPGRVRATQEWEAALETAFTRAGFAVVHPETLPIAEQVRLVHGADVLAGASGSALHLSAFARPGTRVLEIGDSRSPVAPMPTQRMVDAACGHRAAFVPYGDLAALDGVLAALDDET